MDMPKRVFPKVFYLISLILPHLIAGKALAQPSDPPLDQRYRRAIQDAALVEKGDNVSGLIEITPDNNTLVWNEDRSKVLMVTWKRAGSYEKYIKSFTRSSRDQDLKKLIWVTAAPQLQDFCQKYLQANPQATLEELKTRIKQYLGLDPEWEYDIFVEMWVSPEDLFRPCVDPQIDDDQCQREFDEKERIPKVMGKTPGAKIEDYRHFYYQLYFQSIRSRLQPWTGLGYTYDWGNPIRPVGASEFILIPGAEYAVKQTPKPTMAYCQAE